MRQLLIVTTALILACGSPPGDLPAPDGVSHGVTRIPYAGGAYDVEHATGADRTGMFRVRLPPDAVLLLLPAAFEELGLSGGQVLDTRQRIYGFVGVAPRRIAGQRLSNYIDCGHQPGGANADFYRVNLEVVAMARLDDDVSRIEFRIDGTARPMSTTGNPVRCATLGRLERLIVDRVERAAGIGVETDRRRD